jgi:phage terminase small subunit
MSHELTPKQEKFCQKYIELGNASEAYRTAYDAEDMKPVTIRRKAAELLANGKVAAHIARLRETHQQRHLVTVDSLTAELEEARDLAKETKQSATLVAATLGKAKLHGLIVDKNEHAGKDGAPLPASTVNVSVTSELVKDIVQQVRDEF